MVESSHECLEQGTGSSQRSAAAQGAGYRCIGACRAYRSFRHSRPSRRWRWRAIHSRVSAGRPECAGAGQGLRRRAGATGGHADTRVVRRAFRSSTSVSAAHPLGRRRANRRRSLQLRPVVGRNGFVPVCRRQSPRPQRVPGRATQDCGRHRRRAFRRVGAECPAGVGGRRFQRLGRAPASDAPASSHRRLGVVHPAPAGRGHLQIRNPRRPRHPAVEGRSRGAGHQPATGHRLESRLTLEHRLAGPGLDVVPG
ncbi:hypothetical protein D3C86_1479370 [compost metagenome]